MLQVWFLTLVSLVNPNWSVVSFSGHNQQLIPLNFAKDWMLQVHFIYIWLILGLTIACPMWDTFTRIENFKLLAKKVVVVAHESWSLMWNGHLQEVVTEGGLTVSQNNYSTQPYCTWTHNHLVAATFIVRVYICTPQFHGNLLNGNAFLLLFWSRIDCKKFETGDLL